ncbi:MAG: lipopolysaccharide heptosyltransferase II [Acidobacteria bacterium]|nr:lipopolysaccharide heptosyltransferase II [Acidobacteriota bacterium]
MHPRKILIRGPNWIGDAVLAVPAMKALRARFPEAEITILVRPWVAGLFSSAPFIDRVWSEPRPTSLSDWKRITRHIRVQDFDLAVLLPNSFESALMMYLSGIPNRVGYATDGRSWMLTNAVAPAGEARHQVFYYLDLVKSLSANVAEPSITIEATNEERANARKLLSAEGIPHDAQFMVLNPGAAYGSAKRWDTDRFGAVADALASELRFAVAIIGSANERDVAETITIRLKSRAAVLSGKTSLETLIGVLAEASLMITNDSGPMHIAAALGTPTVAVFGSTDERVTSPFGPRTRVVKRPVECSPCLLRDCPIDHRCMENVSVDDVYRAAKELVG